MLVWEKTIVSHHEACEVYVYPSAPEDECSMHRPTYIVRQAPDKSTNVFYSRCRIGVSVSADISFVLKLM